MRSAALLLLGAAACAAAGEGGAESGGAYGAASGARDQERLRLPVSVAEATLRVDTLAAELALVDPQLGRELVRSLIRAEFTRREAERLDIVPDEEEVEASLEGVAGLWLSRAETAGMAWRQRRGLAADASREQVLDALAQEDYGRSWAELRAALAVRIRVNQLYQLVLRADAHEKGRLRVLWLLCPDEASATAIAGKLRLGADPAVVLGESLLPDTPPQGQWVAAYLPGPFAAALASAEVGAVAGPLRLPGDAGWRVALLRGREAPGPQPPSAVLLAGLREQPIGAEEARAWFEEMSRRYTARTGPLPVSSPEPAFEPLRRP